MPLARFRSGAPVTLGEGVLFTTYATLRSEERHGKASRLQQIVDWLGRGFDGVIVFDEAHAMANAAGDKGERGDKALSLQGRAGLRLQHALRGVHQVRERGKRSRKASATAAHCSRRLRLSPGRRSSSAGPRPPDAASAARAPVGCAWRSTRARDTPSFLPADRRALWPYLSGSIGDVPEVGAWSGRAGSVSVAVIIAGRRKARMGRRRGVRVWLPGGVGEAANVLDGVCT